MVTGTCSISLIIFLLLFSTQILGQNYWDKVPELPSQCYYEHDNFSKIIHDLRTEIRKKEEKIKQADYERLNNMSDEEKMAAAMRLKTIKPHEIVKFQAEMMGLTENQVYFQEKVTAIESRYNQLKSEFRAELHKRLSPIEEEYRKLPDGKGASQKDIERAGKLMEMFDTEYESICNTYLSAPDAKFRNWLIEFHKFLIEQELPFNEKMLKMEYAQYGITPDFSVISLRVTDRYLEKVLSISGLRRPYPQRG